VISHGKASEVFSAKRHAANLHSNLVRRIIERGLLGQELIVLRREGLLLHHRTLISTRS
jgi:hypothetical protein